MKKLFIILAFFLISNLLVIGDTTCNQFKISHKIEGNDLYLSLKTDLPDNTKLAVGVSRSYKQNNEEYPLFYYKEVDDTVKQWKEENVVNINTQTWLKELKKQTEDFSLKGVTSGKVTDISPDINISFILPLLGQPKGFGKLQGKATKIDKLLGAVIKDNEIDIKYPLDTKQ